MKKITLYSMKVCPYCVQAKRLLTERGVTFEEILIDYDDEVMWNELYKRSGMQTVPQIYVDGACLGGHIELAALDKKDRLASLKA